MGVKSQLPIEAQDLDRYAPEFKRSSTRSRSPRLQAYSSGVNGGALAVGRSMSFEKDSQSFSLTRFPQTVSLGASGSKEAARTRWSSA